MPTAVLMITGQMAVMKITKIADGCAVAKGGERDGEPGQRRHGAQHLEDRVETAHGPRLCPTSAPSATPTMAGQAEADGDALQDGQHAPAEPDVLRTQHEPGIDDQVLGVLPDLERRAAGVAFGPMPRSATPAGSASARSSGGTTIAPDSRQSAADAAGLAGAAWKRHHRGRGTGASAGMALCLDATRAFAALCAMRAFSSMGLCSGAPAQTTARLIDSDFR